MITDFKLVKGQEAAKRAIEIAGRNIDIDGSRTTACPVGYFHRGGQGQLVGCKGKPQDRTGGPFPAALLSLRAFAPCRWIKKLVFLCIRNIFFPWTE